MPFVQRDSLNRVVGKWTIQQFPNQEFLPDGHPDLVFVETQEEKDAHEIAEVDNAFQVSKIQRLIFEIEFDQENRIRALERAALGLNKPTVTRLQYRDILLNAYKALP